MMRILIAAAAVALLNVAHAQQAPAPQAMEMKATGPGKAAGVRMLEIRAVVVGLNKADRSIDLKGANGRVVTLQVGDEVKNYDLRSSSPRSPSSRYPGLPGSSDGSPWGPGRRSPPPSSMRARCRRLLTAGIVNERASEISTSEQSCQYLRTTAARSVESNLSRSLYI